MSYAELSRKLPGIEMAAGSVRFSAELRMNLNARDPRGSLEKLACLADHQLSFLETVQLDRAIDRLALKDAPGFQPIRLAVLASSTVDQLAPAIRVAGLRRKMLIGVHIGAYGQYRQEIFDQTSSFHKFAPQATLFSLSARETIGTVPVTATVENVEETIAKFINELRLLWRKVRERHNSTIIQQNFIDVTEPLFGSYDCIVPLLRPASS